MEAHGDVADTEATRRARKKKEKKNSLFRGTAEESIALYSVLRTRHNAAPVSTSSPERLGSLHAALEWTTRGTAAKCAAACLCEI